jgi:hypothetical protein
MKDSEVMEINLLQFSALQITEQGLTLNPKSLEVLKEIWDALYNDHGFFIFFEGDFTQLRCSCRNCKQVNSWTGRHKILTGEWKRWEEPWEHTNKFKDWYQQLFHLYTQAMFMFDSREDFIRATDRVTHCFLNLQIKHVHPENLVVSSQMEASKLEAKVLTNAALNRAVMAGLTWGRAERKKQDEKI